MSIKKATPSDYALERPRCPSCRQEVDEDPIYCPGCKTPYHPPCLKGDGCVVAGCSGKPLHVPPGAEQADPSSPLWGAVRGGWIVTIGLGLFLAMASGPGSRPSALGRLWGVVGFVTFLLTTLVFSHDLMLAPRRRDRHGTTGWACVGWAVLISSLCGMLRLPLVEPIFVLGSLAASLAWIVGALVDRRRTRAGFGVAVIFFGCVVSAIAVPGFNSARERANTRACYANQKTVAGALEMYNLDRATKVTRIDASVFGSLKSGGYLCSIPQDPGQGPGTSGNYRWTSGGNGIRCTIHGDIH